MAIPIEEVLRRTIGVDRLKIDEPSIVINDSLKDDVQILRSAVNRMGRNSELRIKLENVLSEYKRL